MLQKATFRVAGVKQSIIKIIILRSHSNHNIGLLLSFIGDLARTLAWQQERFYQK
jgi:hypothetical protein